MKKITYTKKGYYFTQKSEKELGKACELLETSKSDALRRLITLGLKQLEQQGE